MNTRGSFVGKSKTAHEFCEKVEMINKLKSMRGLARYVIGGIIALKVVSSIIIGMVGEMINTERMPTSETAPKLKMLIGKQHNCAETDVIMLVAM